MNVLYCYRFDPAYHFDRYFHTDMVPFFEKAGHKCMAYGYDLEKGYNSDIVLQPYKSSTTFKELYERFPFDIILLGTESRMFLEFRPPLVPPPGKEIREKCWLPKDFKEWKGIKVLADEDNHYSNNTNWLHEVGIDLVLQRHYSNVQRFKDMDKNNIKCKFWPFSVDIDLFKPDPNIKRINKLAMASSVVHEIYKWRKMQLEKLVPLNLMEDFKEQRKVGDSYVKCLQEYVSHGCCTSIYDIFPAKTLEIQSSGSLLFIDDNPESGIFNTLDKSNLICYNRDGSDMVEKAQWIINNPEEVAIMTKNARKDIELKHSHEIRIKELVELINKEI